MTCASARSQPQALQMPAVLLPSQSTSKAGTGIQKSMWPPRMGNRGLRLRWRSCAQEGSWWGFTCSSHSAARGPCPEQLHPFLMAQCLTARACSEPQILP